MPTALPLPSPAVRPAAPVKTNTLAGRYVHIRMAGEGPPLILAIAFQPWRQGMSIPGFLRELRDRRRQLEQAQDPAAAAVTLVQTAIDPTAQPAFDPRRAERLLAWPTSPRRCQILKRLMRVPFGRTISYGELARAVTPPSGARAVGQTMNKNPFPLVVPCHRVIQTGGGLGGFGGGLDWKRALLDWEAAARR